jgi:hypothetical protein
MLPIDHFSAARHLKAENPTGRWSRLEESVITHHQWVRL